MAEFIQPSDILKDFIKGYYIVEINSSTPFLPCERVFPTGNACMVFHYGSPSLFIKKSSDAYIEPNLVICGQQNSYYDLSLAGNTGMILIIFTPYGLQAFFHFPAKELSNENLAFKDLTKKGANELEDKLLSSENNKQRIEILESFFIQKLIFSKDFERIEYAVKLIEQYKGQIKTRQLAGEICLGIKQFERIFSVHVGMTPKKFSGIVRLQHIIKTKNKYKNPDLNQLAIDNGYYDQSHFIHDFKKLTGQTPGDFFNKK
ncbi:helix-turn-helix domain-containing protein [Maribellus maritimus]|uniref:helix-turn-helix domain-containing protein n=1 Tax=Maribellus maritimus TaxID=2870838 RepID=UPI001EEAE2E5|nr:helix-turn-helix domain-containing protein [Maribellus maritimus]MCG6188935.1 helix-turn-helix domain-containing protein [Maribellus maritimus]